jgi:phosphatidylglycerol---prolipoprotein diacylglyceryl transferase
MRQTLFVIPQDWLEGPLLIGWLLLGMILMLGAWLMQSRRSQSGQNYPQGNTSPLSHLPLIIIGAAVIQFLLPNLSIQDVNPNDPMGELIDVGIAVRGYGLFLLLAILLGVAVTLWRAAQIGIVGDKIISLAFFMIIGGIAGARLFYVIQKYPDYQNEPTWWSLIGKILDVTSGGLVVYGSLIGGSIAAGIYCKLNRWRPLTIVDLIAPGMVLGLAIGRIGCLMNGCCYGGICDTEGLPRLTFPAGSAPYLQQLIEGDLIGIKTEVTESVKDEPSSRKIKSIDPEGIGATLSLQPNDQIMIFPPEEKRLRFFKQNPELLDDHNEMATTIYTDRSEKIELPINQLPIRSIGTHPTQVYSSIDAFLLFAMVWIYWYLRKNDGEVFALMLIMHGISRFLLEIIRQDESGIFGTNLTISQWISLLLIMVGIVLMGSVKTRNSGLQPIKISS